jgi:glycolate oxidase iron-sulfur subunit
MNELQELYSTLLKCAQCGDCQRVCPAYQATKYEGWVARGRLATLRYAVEGEIPVSEDLKKQVGTCLMCKSCEANCSSKVPVTEILQATREMFARQQKMPFLDNLIFSRLLPYPGRLKLGNRLLKMYLNTGLRSLVKKTGLIGILGPMAKAEDFLPKTVGPTLRDKEEQLQPNPAKPKVNVGYFLGCGTNIVKSAQAVAAVNTLRERGCRVDIPAVVCCGLPAASYGYTEIARAMAKKNIDTLLKTGYDYITSDCVSCSSQLKHYANLFDGKDPYHEKASKIAGKVVDYAELFLKLNSTQNLSHRHQKVTYHVPCHMARGLNIVQEPQAVLQSIEGIEFVPLDEADSCCGAAGSYFVTHGDISEAILRRKMEKIQASGADIVVTSCPVCVMQLEHGAELFQVPVTVKHLAEIVDESSSGKV